MSLKIQEEILLRLSLVNIFIKNKVDYFHMHSAFRHFSADKLTFVVEILILYVYVFAVGRLFLSRKKQDSFTRIFLYGLI